MSEITASNGHGTSAPGPPGELLFAVLDAQAVPHAAAPVIRFTLQITEPRQREIYTIALSTQVHIDPARRTYDGDARERLVDLFGAPERWAATTHSFMWAKVDALVPTFAGETQFTLDVPCTYDLEVASAKYFDALRDGEVPLSMHFNGTILYAGEQERLQVVLVPWSSSARWRMPVDVWRRTIAAHYPGGGWIRLQSDTLDALARAKSERGDHSFDDTVRGLLE